MDKYKLYRTYRKKYGAHAQSMVAMEECAELIKSISKYHRNGDFHDVIDEIADVFITCEQLLLNIADNHGYVSDETMLMVENVMDEKRVRMAERIGEEYDNDN